MSNRIYLIEKGEWRKFVEYQDEDFVRLVIEAKQGGEWTEANSTPISKAAVLAAARLLNIPLLDGEHTEYLPTSFCLFGVC